MSTYFMCVCVCAFTWVSEKGTVTCEYLFAGEVLEYSWCVCACMCVTAYTDLESKRWLLFPVALTEDRILWTAHKVCSEYLSLFIFAGLRYFNVSSAFSLRATRTHHAVPTHAIAEGGGEGWGWWCRQVAFAPQWALFICAAPLNQSKKAISVEDIWTSDYTEYNHQKWHFLLETSRARPWWGRCRTERGEYSSSQYNMENFTAFILL